MRGERGIAVQAILMLLFLAVAALTMAFLLSPMEDTKAVAEEQAEGSIYENQTHEMTKRTWQAFSLLPVIGTLMAVVFGVVSAIVLSSRV
ncbi:hypothetical protein [Haloarchaeobius sp. DFWS5]|uniref:hypothetical protein n=1 Tax=Haloarchaeobius sp. DFWS5 TaxID=3446114 RepID=UPI003EB99BC2